jgi:hypothetical protein
VSIWCVQSFLVPTQATWFGNRNVMNEADVQAAIQEGFKAATKNRHLMVRTAFLLVRCLLPPLLSHTSQMLTRL